MSSSSPAPTSSPSSSAGRRSSPSSTALAFLVHSPTTVANSMPPEVDNKPLARQRRRRTSKEDEEILKAEYVKNPKPDKAARMEIVTKVALGEKEVQIWFQNKRQNDRRRSRPLDPSSSASLMSSSSTMSDPATEEEMGPPETEHTEEQKTEERALQVEIPEATVATELASDDSVEEPRSEESVETTKTQSQTTTESTTVSSADPQTVETVPTELSSSQQSQTCQNASQSRTSWISNRRSASFRFCNEDYAPEAITFPNAPTTSAEEATTTRSLKRAHSFVRISTNEDGTARVVTDLDKTPSPPHAKTNPNTFSRASAGLRRSFSAAGLNDRLAAAARGERSPKMPRTSSNVGRSRDSRAWEFWCDPDSRYNTSLTTRAEQEGSGSAADAIGLLRANRRILQQNQARQNTPVLSRHSSSKVLGEQGVKKNRGPMQRASTFSGGLQTQEPRKKKVDETDSDELPQTESDKENWEPDVPQSQMRRPRQPQPATNTQRRREVLGENTEVMSQSSSLGAMLAKERGKGVNGEQENSDPEQDDELTLFMNGGGLSGRTSLSSAEEAGCVEGLLKLSQGQWR